MSEKKLDEDFLDQLEGVPPLQRALHLGTVAQRQRLVENIVSARQEIAQIFHDVEHWNTHVRRPHEAPIDPDPDGALRKLATYYDRLLKNDLQ